MVPNAIKAGIEVFTRVSGDTSARVRVIEDTGTGTFRYRVVHIATGTVLRGLRSAGQLHETAGPWNHPWQNGKPKVAAPVGAPKPKKVPSMGAKSQAELLQRLEALPQETRQFIKELIDVFNPSSGSHHSAAEVRG